MPGKWAIITQAFKFIKAIEKKEANIMSVKQGVPIGKMAARVYNREDNQYKKSLIKEVLYMYADEVRKALLDGERVQINKVGTIIPEVKTHLGSYSLPSANKYSGGNPPPYTRIRMSRSVSIKEDMDKELMENIGNGVYGLKNTPFDTQQINILKKGGFIPSDEE